MRVLKPEYEKLGETMARSLFSFKGNPVSFDCTEEQLAIMIGASIQYADQTREAFAGRLPRLTNKDGQRTVLA
jgi:hypothetical protein